MNLVIPKRLLKRLSKLPKGTNYRIMSKLEKLRQDPEDPTLDIKRLSGKFAGKYRLRVGGFRVIYFLKDEDIVISSFGPRGGVYK